MTRWVGADPIRVIEAPPLHPRCSTNSSARCRKGPREFFGSSAMLRRAERRAARDRRGFTSRARADRSSRRSSGPEPCARVRLDQRATAAASHGPRAPTGELSRPRGAAAMITPLRFQLQPAARGVRQPRSADAGARCSSTRRDAANGGVWAGNPSGCSGASARSGQLTAYRADLPDDRRGRLGQRRCPGRRRRRPK